MIGSSGQGREEGRAEPAPGWRAWVGFLAMCVGMFMAILDIQIVASALPEVQSGLAIPMHWLSWTQTAYLIAEVVAIALTAWLSRTLSTGGLFVGAVLGFTLASIGCAASRDVTTFLIFRAIQGFFGGAIIPTVFAAGYRLFPERLQVRATMVAGLFAMLAPALGPLIGGWIAQTWSWRWLFLVNVAPGLVVAMIAAAFIRIDRANFAAFRQVDGLSVLGLAGGLAMLELFLKEGPPRHWADPVVFALAAATIGFGVLFFWRCRVARLKLIDLALFEDRRFAVACLASAMLGVVLYGSSYLMPVFLGFVRMHEALEIGTIMIVTGGAQLIAAPLVAAVETRANAVRLATLGFALLALGAALSTAQTPRSDFAELLLPQIVRGAAFMLCLLPITTLALAHLPADRLSDASALFNLLRNLGGAIGLAGIDTVLEQNAPGHVAALVARLKAGDPTAALFVGLPVERFKNEPLPDVDEATRQMIEPLVERAAATLSTNDAWWLMAAAGLAALAVLISHARSRRATGR